MAITLQFFGAARQVTGSKHLLGIGNRKILIDCGMVQGPRRIATKLNSRLAFSAKNLDAVVLTHAHVDHSGSLPLLVKAGFRGAVHCTHATRDLLGVMLPDSARLQAQDARHLMKKRGEKIEPPYDTDDVERTLTQTHGIGYHERFTVCDGVQATFLDAGHILGSAQVLLEVRDGSQSLRIVFTGDFGRKGMPILRDPDPTPEHNVLITESTYGDRKHPPIRELRDQVLEFVNEQRGRGGRLLIPAFSVGRTQNLLWYLSHLFESGVVDRVPIHVDSPMSTKVTAITARHRDLFDEETQAVLDSGRDPFNDGVVFIADAEESKALNRLREGIIISASGMCEGGRILHHLEQSITRSEDTVLLVGYQAQGTLGRKLLEGYEHVKIFGQRYPVRCRVQHIDGLSAHADYAEMIEHFAPHARTTQQVFVVHGEEDPALKFADRLVDAGFRSVDVPVYKDVFTLK